MSSRGRSKNPSKPSNNGFRVIPSHAPHTAYLGKAKKLKESLIERARIKKTFAKTLKKEGLSSSRLTRGAGSSSNYNNNKNDPTTTTTGTGKIEKDGTVHKRSRPSKSTPTPTAPSSSSSTNAKHNLARATAESESDESELESGEERSPRSTRKGKGKGRDGGAVRPGNEDDDDEDEGDDDFFQTGLSREENRAGPVPPSPSPSPPPSSSNRRDPTTSKNPSNKYLTPGSLPYTPRPGAREQGRLQGRGQGRDGREGGGKKLKLDPGNPNAASLGPAPGAPGSGMGGRIAWGVQRSSLSQSQSQSQSQSGAEPTAAAPTPRASYRNKPLHSHPLPSLSSRSSWGTREESERELREMKRDAYLSGPRSRAGPGAGTGAGAVHPGRTRLAARRAERGVGGVPEDGEKKGSRSVTPRKNGNGNGVGRGGFGSGTRTGTSTSSRGRGQPLLGKRMGVLLEEIQRRG